MEDTLCRGCESSVQKLLVSLRNDVFGETSQAAQASKQLSICVFFNLKDEFSLFLYSYYMHIRNFLDISKVQYNFSEFANKEGNFIWCNFDWRKSFLGI